MARDAKGRDRLVFDLVDDDPAVHDVPAAASGPATGDDPDGAPGGDPTSGSVWRLRLPLLALVAAVLAVALGTGFAVDGVRAAERIERVRELPGGVVDVSSPLEQTWAWEGQVGSDRLDGEMLVADLQGVLAFQSGDELVALDPASGEEAWSVPLGEDSECGPAGYAGASRLATSRLVCLQGDAGTREALTVGPDGVASEPRVLAGADERRYGRPRPGPEGTVLRAKRIGDRSTVDVGEARCTEETGECSGTVDAGRDLLLRAEDAATGEERWAVTVPFRTTAAQDCTPWFGLPWNGWEDVPSDDDALAPDAFGAQIGAGLVDVWGCGVSAAVTPGGALLEAEGVGWSGMTVGLGGGGYALATPPGPGEAMAHTTLFAADGTVVGEIPEYASGPRTTDEPEGATLLASGPSGGELRSYAKDGSLRWEVAGLQSGPPDFLAQVDGTLVTSSWTGGFRGLDLATGAERWTSEAGEAMGDPSYDLAYVSQVFTDGRSVLLPLQGELGAVELVTVDVTSGELGWNRPLADLVGSDQNTILVAVDGRLLALTPEGVRGLG